MDTDLCKLALKWGSDKTPLVPRGHSYTPYYHELLSGRGVKKLLEIGIGYPATMLHVAGYIAGASLFMWQEYLPNVEIYALDNKPEILINEGRIKSFYCDQGDEKSLMGVMGKIGNDFDLIIDDGSHVPEHQILSARLLVPLLGPNGTYIIEDVLHPEIVVPQLPYKCEVKEFRTSAICDDRLVVIRRQNG